MSTILKQLQRIGDRRPYWPIRGDDGSLYMGRWWLFGGSYGERDSDKDRPYPRTWRKTTLDALIGFYLAARLHLIARADRGRHFHTHPFNFLSIVIAGWYVERLPLRQSQHPSLDQTHYREVLRRPGSIAFRRARDRHTITAVSPGGVWTVFVMGRKVSSWGFWKPTGFVNWRDYTGGA